MKDINKTKAQLIEELQELKQQLPTLKTHPIQAKNKNEEKLHIFSDAAFDAIFLSEKGICLEQNSIAREMFGYSNKEAIGKPGIEWIVSEHRVLVEEKMISGFEKSYEVTALCKGGTTFPCEIRGKMIDYKGRKIRVTALRDISARKKAEDVLKKSREKYRIFVDFTYDWEYWINPDNNYIYISPSVERITVYNKDGKFLGTRGSNRDITECKKAEQALKESESRLKIIAENMPVMLDAFDEKGNIIIWNKECELVTGFKADEIIKNPKAAYLLYPDENYRTFIIEKLKKYGGNFRNLEWNITCKDGSRKTILWSNISEQFPITGWFSWAIGIDITERKIAEQALMESERRYHKLFEDSPVSLWEEDFSEVEKYFDKLKKQGIQDFRKYFEKAPDEVIKCANKIKIIDVNRAAVELHQAESKKHLLENKIKIFADKSFNVFKDEMIALAEGASTFEIEIKFFTLKDELRHVFLKLFVGKTKDNKRDCSKVLVAISDVTSAKKAEEERLNLEKQILHTQKLESLGVLAGGIAHDFNNLLAAILGNADLAMMKLPETNPASKNVNEIINATCRAADLANQMLAYSGKGKFVIELINLSELVKEMSTMLKVSISKKITLQYNFADTSPYIEADSTQIRQIIMNLITNASEAIGKNNGAISIETGTIYCNYDYFKNCIINEEVSDGDYSYLEVADNGCGMDEETISKLFDPFFTSKFTGRGLGMAAVLGIIKSHKGSIKVESKPGKETLVKVLFPSIKDYAKNEEVNEITEKTSVSNFQGVVLVVDDIESVRTICAEMLEILGFSVLIAEDGLDALKILQEKENRKKIACIILDLTMPKLDGEQTYNKLREHNINIPIILASGYTEQKIAGRFCGENIVGFIQKPFLINDLKIQLKKIFEK